MTDPTPEQTPGGELGPLALPAIPPRPAGGGPILSVWGQAVHDALFGAATLPDVRDGWGAKAVGANVGSGDMARLDGGLPPLAGFSGAVVGLWWRKAGTITGGSISIGAQVGGTISPLTVLNAGSASTGLVMLAAPLAVSAASAIRVNYSSAALAPATIDVYVGLLVRYDYVPG
jgi:hypothetical protein